MGAIDEKYLIFVYPVITLIPNTEKNNKNRKINSGLKNNSFLNNAGIKRRRKGPNC